jgi:DNA-directed RNA polymerase specialized sigma24 family protein
MARIYEWPARVAAAIATLPDCENGLPEQDLQFWARVDAVDDSALPLEVLAYLARTAYKHNQHSAADRVFAAIWSRASQSIALYAMRKHGHYLAGALSAEDIVVEVFSRLGTRLRSASGITFYEVALLGGVRIMVNDHGRDIDRTFVASLDTPSRDADSDEQYDLIDDGAVDPDHQIGIDESRLALRGDVHQRLERLPPRARQTATLLMQWQSETAIATALGVSTRMVRNYKAQIRAALDGLQ